MKVIKYNSSLVEQWFKIHSTSAAPKHITTDGTNHYLTVPTANYVLLGRNSDGFFLGTFGSTGSGDGQFSTPWGIAYGGSEVYVVDQGNSRVQVFTTSGTYVRKWTIPASCRGIAVNTGVTRVFVADYAGDLVRIYHPTTGALLDDFPQANADGIGCVP